MVHREKVLSRLFQWHLLMENIFSAMVASSRFGREYSIQVTIKMNMVSSFGEDMSFLLGFCLFDWFGLFALEGFFGWLIFQVG